MSEMWTEDQAMKIRETWMQPSSNSAVQRRVSLRWSKELPCEQGWYWWWDEDPDGIPVPVSIMKSGTDGRYFATAGQLGWNRPQYVEDMGGQWMRLLEPETAN